MKKDDFISEITDVNDRIEPSIHNSFTTIHHKRRGFRGFRHDLFEIEHETSTKYTKTNLEKIKEKIEENKDLIDDWHEAWKHYTKTKKYRRRKKKDDFKKLALETDLEERPGNGYDRGDYYYLRVLDFVYKKKDLEKYHASGDMLGVVNQTRQRVYAKSSKWSPSERKFRYLVGRNENGNAFAHPIPNHIKTLKKAIDWIWDGNKIVDRQGDIAITPAPHLKNPPSAVEDDRRIIDSHRVEGEIYENGAMYVRNGKIYHSKGQHPEIEVGDDWMRILIARESDNDEGNATVD